MLVSPDRPCEKCNGIVFDLRDDGRTCLDCRHFMADIPLEDVCHDITARILRSRLQEEKGEEDYD